MRNNSIDAFLAFLRAGLWEKEAWPSKYSAVDYDTLVRLAEEQSVVGLISAGIERTVDAKIPQPIVLQFVGNTLQIEERNKAMNVFIAELIEEMRKAGIYTLLVKGQGVAQCYERPLWRVCGDVDLFLNKENYHKAVRFLEPLASSSREEGVAGLHHEMVIETWHVELHGDLRSGLSRKMDRVLDEVRYEIFYKGNVRSWQNCNVQVFLPAIDVDVVYVFSHIIKHLFKGGIGLRQICDWCRLLWSYNNRIDEKFLERRIITMGLMTEWRVFAALAVDYLGMPADAVPMYDSSTKWRRKADIVLRFVLESGNFGHNRDVSYQTEYSSFVRKFITLWRQVKDNIKLSFVFPLDSFKFLISFTVIKTKNSFE